MLKLKKIALVFSVLLASVSSAHASYISYSNQSSFLSAVVTPATDDFTGNFSINSNATMKSLSVGNIDYVSTGFSDWNIIVGGSLCWGCNGSGYMGLTDTTVGTSNGVYGFSTNYLGNSGYNAYVTFGNDSTLDILLSGGSGFLGLTSTDLIKKVEFAHARNLASQDGSIQFDQVTVGAARGVQVPEPAAVALLGLGLFGFAAARRSKQ